MPCAFLSRIASASHFPDYKMVAMMQTDKMAGQYGVLGFWGCLPSLMTRDLALNCWESFTSRWWKAQVVRLGLLAVCSPMESLRGHVCSQEDFGQGDFVHVWVTWGNCYATIHKATNLSEHSLLGGRSNLRRDPWCQSCAILFCC